MERNKPAPDAICVDDMTGTALVIEVSEIHVREISPEAQAYAEHLSDELRTLLDGRFVGSMNIVLPIPIPKQAEPVSKTARRVAASIAGAVSSRSVGQHIELRDPFPFAVWQGTGATSPSFSPMFRIPASSDDIRTMMLQALQEAAVKFAEYDAFERVMLFVANPLFFLKERELFEGAAGGLSTAQTTHVHKMYVLNGRDRILRLK